MAEKKQKEETLKTFDMYRFFSRKDVILAIILIVFALAYVVYKALSAPVVA